jgi:hypothetical protein
MVQERNVVYHVLLDNEDLFSGKFQGYPNNVLILKLEPDAKPPYAVPNINLSTSIDLLRLVFLFQLVLLSSKRKMVQLVSLVIFINGKISLNDPIVQKFGQVQKLYQYFTKIDISMHYAVLYLPS